MITDCVGTLVLLPFAFALFIYFYCTFQAFKCWIVELKYNNDNDHRMWNVGSQKWYSKLKVNELPCIPLKSFQHKLIFTSMDDLPSATRFFRVFPSGATFRLAGRGDSCNRVLTFGLCLFGMVDRAHRSSDKGIEGIAMTWRAKWYSEKSRKLVDEYLWTSIIVYFFNRPIDWEMI